MAKLMAENEIETEFHAVVKTLAKDTLGVVENIDQLYDLVSDYIRDGHYESLAEHIGYEQIQVPSYYESRDIVEAADEKNGLRKLAKQAAMAETLLGLAVRWDEVVAVTELLPSLTWPVIKVKKLKKKSKKRKE